MTVFFSAWHFDGISAVRRVVEVQAIGAQFYLLERERRHGPFDFADLRFAGMQGDAKVYELDDCDGWRLGLVGTIPDDLTAQLPLPEKYGRWIDRIGLGPASLGFAIASIAVVSVVLLAPQWLAPLVPYSVERKLGEALVGDFGGRFCSTPDGSAALKKLTAKLDDKPQELQVEVANIDMVNAVALPGGKVLLFQGLIDEAKSPDEVAGVLAHEIGHVRNRHVMQGLLRQTGLAVVLGGFDGSGGGQLNSMLATTYTRESEREADNHSLKAMKTAAISPRATSDFFRRLSAMDGSGAIRDDGQRAITNYMSSHPLSDDRRRLFNKNVIKDKTYHPALTDAEWLSVKTMCARDKDVKSGWGFDFE